MNIFNLEKLQALGQVEPNSIINADCLEAMKYIADKSIDTIICDLPYGITACKWDTVIPFELLWEQYKRIIKPSGAIALFGSQPFSSALVMSNPSWFKYEWIWDKKVAGGMSYARYRPMSKHENISIFCKGKTKYYPQKENRVVPIFSGGTNHSESAPIKHKDLAFKQSYFDRFPTTLIPVLKVRQDSMHPTQKPVELIEYLIKTYTQEGELILDNTAGSGTLAIAAINTNRRYICIEKDEHYFEVMRSRIESHNPDAVKSRKPTVSDQYVQLSLFGG